MGPEGLSDLEKGGARIYSHDAPRAIRLEKLLIGDPN
jgi:hypothetical protein